VTDNVTIDYGNDAPVRVPRSRYFSPDGVGEGFFWTTERVDGNFSSYVSELPTSRNARTRVVVHATRKAAKARALRLAHDAVSEHLYVRPKFAFRNDGPLLDRVFKFQAHYGDVDNGKRKDIITLSYAMSAYLPPRLITIPATASSLKATVRRLRPVHIRELVRFEQRAPRADAGSDDAEQAAMEREELHMRAWDGAYVVHLKDVLAQAEQSKDSSFPNLWGDLLNLRRRLKFKRPAWRPSRGNASATLDGIGSIAQWDGR
jgi:hypothetical protein